MTRSALQFVALVVFAFHTRAADGPAKGYVSAKFDRYDAERKLLTVIPGRDSINLVVDSKVRILMDDRPTSFELSDLPQGAPLRLTLSEDKTTVQTVNAVGPTVGMTICAINAEHKTMDVRKGSRKSTLVIDENVAIVDQKRKEQVYTLDQVKVGMRAYLFLTFDQTKIRSMRVRFGN